MARKAKKGRARNSREGTPKPTTVRKGGDARTEEQRISHFVNHPVRLDSFVILSEREASPNELCHELEVTLGTASHHVNELADADLIELVETVQRRGAVEHFYRAKARPEVSDAEWQTMTAVNKRRCAGNYLATVIGESLSSLRHGRMENDGDLYIFWMPLKLGAAGRKELHEINAEYQERIEALKERAGTGEGEDDAPVRFVAMLGFERSQRGQPRANAIGRPKE